MLIHSKDNRHSISTFNEEMHRFLSISGILRKRGLSARFELRGADHVIRWEGSDEPIRRKGDCLELAIMRLSFLNDSFTDLIRGAPDG